MEVADAVTLATARSLVRSGVARQIRVAAGLSQAEVAAAIGGSVAAVSRWEAGQRVPHGPAAIRYGELLQALVAR